MDKYIWNEDKITNKFPHAIQNVLLDKNIQPKNLTKEDKIELNCTIHGNYNRSIRHIYISLNETCNPLCPKCARIEATKKIEKTNLERFGTKTPAQNSDVLNKMKMTNKERYGFETVGANPEFMTKIKQTNLEKYGVEHAILNSEVKEKANKVMLEKYGTIHALQNKVIKQKKFNTEYGNNIDIISSIKKDISEFLNFNSIKCKIDYSQLGYILDIYIEKYDIGIRIISLSVIPDKNDHFYQVYNYYKDIGTKVIHIYEDEWLDVIKQKLLKSLILSACNVQTSKSIIYARKLKIMELDMYIYSDKIIDFYNKNHLKGFEESIIHIALVDENDEILECMSFNTNKKDKEMYQYILTRNCSKMDYYIVGGLERIFKYFINNYPYDKKYNNYIITYCDIDKFSGHSYEKLGFVYVDHKIQVWGIEDNYSKRVYRDPKNNDHFKSIPKIYGCGNNLYIYNIASYMKI